MFRSVARNFSILTAARIAEAAIAFLFLAFVARQFGPELFGQYLLIYAYVRLISLIVNAGVAPIAFRELARNRENMASLFDDIISLRLALGLGGYVVLIAVLMVFSTDREFIILLSLAALTLVLEPFTASYTAYFTAHERMGVPSIYGVAVVAVSAGAGVILLLSGFKILALIAINVITALVGTIIWSAIFYARTLRFKLNARLSSWRQLIVMVIPFAPIHISLQLNRVINVILLGRVPGPLPQEQAVGYYGPAQTVTNALVMLVMGIRRALIPPITVKLSRGESVTQEIQITMKLVVVLFCLPLVLVSFFAASEIILILFGDQYGPSVAALMILGWAGALQIAAMVPETFLFSHAEHKMREYIPGAVISVLVNVVLCIFLIGEYGFAGAAIAAVAARLVYFLYTIYYCRRHALGPSLHLRGFFDVLLLVVLSFVLWYAVFAWVPGGWIRFVTAGFGTLVLTGLYLLYLRFHEFGKTSG